ncbi:zinc finger protein 778-like isoform X2 [Anopheles darlingi]|uniref:zinc finger protein 778-like isoform X2 n=1 Tax=Anopheles darlingi TaxID=43151 RepID=UPI0021005DF3|nr:zinc finger protein 778-like isoform X2 [Anopheles darlingi]
MAYASLRKLQVRYNGCLQVVHDLYGILRRIEDTSADFIAGDSNVVEFKEAGIIVDDEEDDQHIRLSDEEGNIDSRIWKTNERNLINTHEIVMFSELQQNRNADETVSEPQNIETMQNESATSHSNKIVELLIEIDYVAPNNTISLEEEYLDDFEESIEYLEDVKDKWYTNAYLGIHHNNAENELIKSAEAVPGVSDTMMNVVRLKEDAEESEDEETFKDFFSSEVFSCNSCQDVFQDKKSHEEHIKNHSKGQHIFCKICSEGFKSTSALNAHTCRHESSTLCWICGKTIDLARKLKTHIQSHMPEDTWYCKLCPLRFPTKGALRNHVVTHKKNNLYCCDVCGANLSTKRNLEEHQWAQHRAKKEERYTISCEICSQRFSSRYVLKRHMNTHTGHRPYSCVYCNRVYGNGADLVEHVAKHHIGNDNIYQCHLCDADFPKIKKLKGHYEVHFRNGDQFYNEILTEFGKFRFSTMDLLKMRHQKEMVSLASIVLPNI